MKYEEWVVREAEDRCKWSNTAKKMDEKKALRLLYSVAKKNKKEDFIREARRVGIWVSDLSNCDEFNMEDSQEILPYYIDEKTGKMQPLSCSW